MDFLICNDDGIDSVGIQSLAKRLSKNNNVMIVAPNENKSATSHSLSILNTIVVEKKDTTNISQYAVKGTPADCIKFSKLVLNIDSDNIVVSGINLGHNLGSDVIYSGTVAICVEASFFGNLSFAFSCPKGCEKFIDEYASMAEKIINYLIPVSKKGDIWNINFPNLHQHKINGVKFTKLGRQVYSDEYVLVKENTYQLVGVPLDHDDNDEDCDIEWVKKGFISVTPIIYDKTNYKILEKFSEKCIKL